MLCRLGYDSKFCVLDVTRVWRRGYSGLEFMVLSGRSTITGIMIDPGSMISVSLTHKIHKLNEAFNFLILSSEISTGIPKTDFSRMDSQLGKLFCEFHRFPPYRKSFFSLPLICLPANPGVSLTLISLKLGLGNMILSFWWIVPGCGNCKWTPPMITRLTMTQKK